MNWWIQDFGDHWVLMVNDYIVSVFWDKHLVLKFMEQFGIPMEIRK